MPTFAFLVALLPALSPAAPSTTATTATPATPATPATTTTPTTPATTTTTTKEAPTDAILVPAPFGAPAEQSLDAQRALIAAMQKTVGERVLDLKDVVAAQLAASITATDLALSRAQKKKEKVPPPPGLARLMTQAHAHSALLVDVRDTETVVYIYVGGEGPASPIVRLPRKKKAPLDDAWATEIATTVKKRAGDALEAFSMEMDVGDASVDDAKPADADIQAEMAKEKADDDARRARLAAEEKARTTGEPFLTALVDGGGAFRFLKVSGPGANALAPLDNGVVPTVGVYASFSPIRALVPEQRPSRFSDTTVEVFYRRGIWDVKDVSAKSCGYDDDDAYVRGGWGGIFADNEWMPKIGVVGGAGFERVSFSCALPVPSTQYANVDGGLHIEQPILPRAADHSGAPVYLEAAGGARVVFLSDDEGAASLAPWAEAFVVARPLPDLRFLEVRVGGRYAAAHVDVHQAGVVALAIDDARLSFDLQLGVAF